MSNRWHWIIRAGMLFVIFGLSISAQALDRDTALLRLDSLQTAALVHDGPSARALVNSLYGQDIETSAGKFRIDPGLVQLVRIADHPHDWNDVVARTQTFRQMIVRSISADPSVDFSPDPALLEKIKARHAVTKIQTGGAWDLSLPISDRLLAWIFLLGTLLMWIKDGIWAFIEWVKSLFTQFPTSEIEKADFSNWVYLYLGVLAITLGILVWIVFRQRKTVSAIRPRVMPGGSADEDIDASSRSASEWETRAETLLQEGRHREAVRAWYHAVLSMLIEQGQLDYHLGATNWEHAYALPSTLKYRPEFLDLTQAFEEHWYGFTVRSPEQVDRFSRHARYILDGLGERT